MTLSIGIDTETYVMYEGHADSGGYPVTPAPLLSPATLSNSSVEAIKGMAIKDLLLIPLVFREDAFDPVSRVRRGRFYEKNNGQPTPWSIYPPAGNQNIVRKGLATFHSSRLISRQSTGIDNQLLVVLGDEARFSVWTVIAIETSLIGEEIVSLRARASFGVLPQLFHDKFPVQGRDQVERTLRILAEDIYRAGPESIVDRARDAASAILAAYLNSPQKDLGSLVDVLAKEPRGSRPNICMNGADILAILHPRTKPSEQARRPLRFIAEQDAELAVRLVGTMLCDLGWAEWR